MPISIIAAISANNVIGINNKLPWSLPKELENFYKLIYQKPVVMGHKTHESIGKPIKDSKNYILSNNPNLQIPGCTVINSIDTILDLAEQINTEIMIIGGESIYQQFLPFANKMYLTTIEHEFIGDTYFPIWSKDDWQTIDQQRVVSETYPYNLITLQKVCHEHNSEHPFNIN